MNKKIATELRYNDPLIASCFDSYIESLRLGNDVAWEVALESMVILMADRHEKMQKKLLDKMYREIPIYRIPVKDYLVKCKECNATMWRSQTIPFKNMEVLYHIKEATLQNPDDKQEICGPVEKLNA